MVAGKLLRYFAFFWVLILCAGTLEYLTFKPDTDFLALKRYAVQTGWYLPAFYSHIFGSSVILICGFFQFSKKVQSNKKLHRLLGKTYILGIVFFSAPGALVMTFFIDRGPAVAASFFIQNILWVLFTLSAWFAIAQGRISSHINMMKRSYALAFAAVTLRFYIFLFGVVGNGVSFENNYLVIALLSWIPNLLMVEIWIVSTAGDSRSGSL